jgi:hypothetical protein
VSRKKNSEGNWGQSLRGCCPKHVFKTAQKLLKKSAKIVKLYFDKCINAKRLHVTDKHKRDLLVYLLWNRGVMTNEQLGIFSISATQLSVIVLKDLKRR